MPNTKTKSEAKAKKQALKDMKKEEIKTNVLAHQKDLKEFLTEGVQY